MLQYKIDLNSDLGESFGAYSIGSDEKIIPLISSANIACGYHASDPVVMDKTVSLAKEAGINIGAHPGFPDLMGFGRRNIKVTNKEARAYVQYQVGALYAFCKAYDIPMKHVKLHGALYNMAAADFGLAEAICQGIYDFDKDLIFLALSGSEMITAANKVGLRVASEVFADRAYEENGSLVARTKKGSMILDENIAIERVVRMIKTGKVETISGKDINIKADSVCVHGDGEKALEFVNKIREVLLEENIDIVPLAEIV